MPNPKFEAKDKTLAQMVAAEMMLRPHFDGNVARPVMVKIGRSVYFGAQWFDKNGRENFALVGRRPKYHRNRSRRVCFTFGTAEYYVATWIESPACEDVRFRDFHPFGETFTLSEWNHGKIDDHYERPYHRQKMTVRHFE